MSSKLVVQARQRLPNALVTQAVVGVRRPKWALPACLVIVALSVAVAPGIIGGALGGALLAGASDRFCLIGGDGATHLFSLPKWALTARLGDERGVVMTCTLIRAGRMLDTWSITTQLGDEEQIMMPTKKRADAAVLALPR